MMWRWLYSLLCNFAGVKPFVSSWIIKFVLFNEILYITWRARLTIHGSTFKESIRHNGSTLTDVWSLLYSICNMQMRLWELVLSLRCDDRLRNLPQMSFLVLMLSIYRCCPSQALPMTIALWVIWSSSPNTLGPNTRICFWTWSNGFSVKVLSRTTPSSPTSSMSIFSKSSLFYELRKVRSMRVSLMMSVENTRNGKTKSTLCHTRRSHSLTPRSVQPTFAYDCSLLQASLSNF